MSYVYSAIGPVCINYILNKLLYLHNGLLITSASIYIFTPGLLITAANVYIYTRDFYTLSSHSPLYIYT